MCFHSKQSKATKELKAHFKADFDDEQAFVAADYNGFNYPKTPVIIDKSPTKIQLFNWGLLPSWTTDINFRQNTLNAKIETIDEKPSFKHYTSQRCLVLIDGFYEWQWLDSSGKKKQKYLIEKPNQEAFALAGLYNIWFDKTTGKSLNTYTILTQEANELMSKIHNSKKRMPVILNQNDEQKWLNGQLSAFADVALVATSMASQMSFDFG